MTWKRTCIWSTSPQIASLDLGPMTSAERACEVRTTTQTTNPATGKKQWQGNKNLKHTQHLVSIKAIFLDLGLNKFSFLPDPIPWPTTLRA